MEERRGGKGGSHGIEVQFVKTLTFGLLIYYEKYSYLLVTDLFVSGEGNGIT